MAEKIIIFGKAGWPFTEKARSAYGDAAAYFDVKADSKKLTEMLKYSGGVRKVPVIVEAGKVTVGYGGSWGIWLPTGYRQRRSYEELQGVEYKYSSEEKHQGTAKDAYRFIKSGSKHLNAPERCQREETEQNADRKNRRQQTNPDRS